MNDRTSILITEHDYLPADAAALIDAGLGTANNAAAPLHEVRSLSCFARNEDGGVLGGAVGRSWGQCCELQQLWVHPESRRRGIGTLLIKTFEALAERRGCSEFYLETFNFQAPDLYKSMGYEVRYEHAVYPHGIVKYIMVHTLPPAQTAA
jgi:ribosomal protein S18 acetylase RimI-like enzyme